MPSYYAILTTLGAQRLAEAQASGIPLVFTDFAVGDGDGGPVTPSASMTALVNEVYRGSPVNVTTSPSAPSTFLCEGLIPSSEGSFTVVEVGLFNGAGELIVIANHPPIYKPLPAEGVTDEMYIRINVEYASAEAVALTVDPSVVTATREYVEDLTGGGLYLQENFT